MDKELAELTDCEYELDVLRADHAEQIGPDDPHYLEVARIQHELAHITRQLPDKRRFVAHKLLEGKTRKQIAHEKDCTPATVGAALADERVQRQIVLLQRLAYIEEGPARSARQALLWRIALREEEKRPNTSIRAVDVMNRADGLYNNDPEGDGGVVIKIKNFVMNPQNEQEQHEKEVNAPIEGEFTPITVTTPD